MHNAVTVRFIGQRDNNDTEYHYLTDLNLKENDYVVVDTKYGIKTAIVLNSSAEWRSAYQWVVCQIDIDAFQVKLKELKRKQFILDQMKKRLSEVDTITQYEKLAETDETMKTLLDAFNTDIITSIEDKDGDLL